MADPVAVTHEGQRQAASPRDPPRSDLACPWAAGDTEIIAVALVPVSHDQNSFIRLPIITSAVRTRPLTLHLSIFATTDGGIEAPVITAAAPIAPGPLPNGLLLFRCQFVQSCLRAGIA